MMNTKEMIEFLKKTETSYVCIDKDRFFNIKEITDLLKRGEKFEAMWEAIVRYFSYMEWKDEIIEKIKQKYLPNGKVIK